MQSKDKAEKLDVVWENLLENYKKVFGVDSPIEKVKPVLEEHLAKLSKDFILSRVLGVDPESLIYLLSKTEAPTFKPVKQETVIVNQVPKGKSNKRS